MSTQPTLGEATRYERLPKPYKVVCLILFTIGIGLCILYVFGWSIRGFVLVDIMYYYLIYAVFLSSVFLIVPARKQDKTSVPWYDLALAVIIFGAFIYFMANTWEISRGLWFPPPSMLTLVLGSIIFLAVLESSRRAAGLPYAFICLIIGTYPLYAEHVPGVLYGYSFTFPELISCLIYSRQGLLGLPGQVMGGIIIGYLIFAGIMIASGAGTFFLNLALALLGRFRGGPAKVAALASGFFGSVSGFPTANVVSTGAITIPAMKRAGYPSHYAAAVEAVASTGGSIMPPIMGFIAFVMVIITNISYADIIIAAFIPAILYYWGLLVQIDTYAARVGLKGLPREEIPSLVQTLKQGWPFMAIIIFLMFGLIYMRWGVKAPIFASALMVIISFASRKTMLTPRKLIAAVATIGNLITYITSIIVAIGLILVGIQITGSLTAVTANIVALAQTNVIATFLIMAMICYIFGMAGIALIPYIVLSVVALPDIVSATGSNLIALHLFLMYYLMTTHITPPVCISVFVASSLASAPPMKTGFTAMRLAVVLYFIPFFFVFNPSLILEGPILESLYLVVLCFLGIWILASGLEGYLLKVGRLSLWSRAPLVVGGFLVALPPWTPTFIAWMPTIIGAALTVLTVAIILIMRKAATGKLISNDQ